MGTVNPIPSDTPRVSPYLIVDGAAGAIDFYCAVVGFTERMRMPGPDGRIGHAELALGDSVVMIADEYPEMDIRGPHAIGGSPVMVHTYVEDVNGVHARALERGATSLRDVEDQFYGDRSAQFVDPWGHRWSIATHVRDVSDEEMRQKAAELAAGE